MSTKRKLSDSSNENESQKKKQKIISTNSNLNQAQIISKNTNNDETYDQSLWATDMPPEILFRIFSLPNLRTSDLRQASAVCWSWNSCLKDDAFGWSRLSVIPLTIVYDGKTPVIS